MLVWQVTAQCDNAWADYSLISYFALNQPWKNAVLLTFSVAAPHDHDQINLCSQINIAIYVVNLVPRLGL